MTQDELLTLEWVVMVAKVKRESDYEIFKRDYGEDNIITHAALRDLEKARKADQICRKYRAEFNAQIEPIDEEVLAQ